MALTTRKRLSLFNFDMPFGRLLPPPDGWVSKSDRYHFVGKYAWFDVPTPMIFSWTLPVRETDWVLLARPTTWTLQVRNE